MIDGTTIRKMACDALICAPNLQTSPYTYRIYGWVERMTRVNYACHSSGIGLFADKMRELLILGMLQDVMACGLGYITEPELKAKFKRFKDEDVRYWDRGDLNPMLLINGWLCSNRFSHPALRYSRMLPQY